MFLLHTLHGKVIIYQMTRGGMGRGGFYVCKDLKINFTASNFKSEKLSTLGGVDCSVSETNLVNIVKTSL